MVHLEREPAPRGATVRNFGLIWVSGTAAGTELTLALRARELWEQIASEVPGTGFRAHGSLTLAGDEAEAALLNEAACLPDAAERGYRLLDAGSVRDLNPALRGRLLLRAVLREGRHRRAAAGSRRRFATTCSPPGHRTATAGFLAGKLSTSLQARCATRPAPGTKAISSSCAPAPRTPAWQGPYLARFDQAPADPPLRRVRLQMLQTEPFDRRLTTSVADGDSLRYYPAYDLPGRARLAPQAPAAAAAARAQLLLAQRLDGSLTIGDTHAYDEPFDFDLDEAPYDHLRSQGRAAARVAAAADQAALGGRLQPDDRARHLLARAGRARASSWSPGQAAAA